MTKIPVSVRIDSALYDWLAQQRDSGRYYNITHAIEEAIRALQKQQK